MKIGIVGSEASKFTPATKVEAEKAILSVLSPGDTVISGGCHLGGIDIWAAEIGSQLGLEVIEFKPASLSWSGGYKERNLQIAQACDLLVCITVQTLPTNYTGMRFKLCYHCKTDTHIKSGGCWTMKQAAKLGKGTQLIVV